MWKCPICNNEEKSKYVCRKCGYDTRKDFIQWRTLSQVSKEDVSERIRLKSGVWNENPSKETDTKKKEDPEKKSAPGFKIPIPVKGFVLIALIAVFIVMGKDKNRIQSAGVTYEDDLDDLCVLGSDIKRRSIRTITFLDTLKRVPEDAWDVSEKQDGSVMAWLEDGDALYFAADGLIKANEDSSYFFAGYTNVEEICYNGAFDTSDVTDMTGMFTECHNLRNCGIDALDTSKVTDMSLMFCNIDNWKSFMHELDTRNVTDMSYMFAECDSLESVSIYGLDTSKVTDTTAMFYNCPKLSRVSELEEWNLSQVTQDADMFIGCPNLPTYVYEGIWERHSEIEKNMLNVDFEDKLEYERYDDVKLQTKKITFLDTLENVPEDAEDVSEHQDGSVMAWYEDEENREHLIIAADGPVIANPDRIQLFMDYQNVEEIDCNQAFDTSRMTDMSFMFCRCLKLTKVDVSDFDTSQVTDMRGMFRDCNALETLDISSFDTANVRDMSYMFTGCRELKQLELGNFEMGYFPSTTDMFLYCSSLDSEIYEGIWDGN